MNDQLLETWQIHCRINLYVLESISSEAFRVDEPAKGRSFARMFAHIHNTRLMWLEVSAPKSAKRLEKFDKDAKLNKAALKKSLAASGEAMEAMLTKSLASGRVKGFKPHLPAFLGYIISHESYHLGEIGIALTQAGYPLDKKIAYGMWEWGVR